MHTHRKLRYARNIVKIESIGNQLNLNCISKMVLAFTRSQMHDARTRQNVQKTHERKRTIIKSVELKTATP